LYLCAAERRVLIQAKNKTFESGALLLSVGQFVEINS
jgi:hypothetical protein